jgi:hypothetical protein
LFEVKIVIRHNPAIVDQKRERARRHKDNVKPVALLAPINFARIIFPPS